MDTQSLLRVSSTRPQDKQPAAARDSQSKQFDQHLQDQVQRAETPEPSGNRPVTAARSTETPGTQAARNGQANAEQNAEQDEDNTAENLPSDVSNTATPDSGEAEIVMLVLAMADDDSAQLLPQDGNMLPPVLAESVLPTVTGEEAQQLAMPATAFTTQQADSTMTRQTATAATTLDVPELLQPLKTDAALQQVPAILADDGDMPAVVTPDMKWPVQPDDVMSDKQFAALITEAGRSSAMSMQQVQAVTGNAAANIQSYVPPQFNAVTTMSAPTFNGSIPVPLNHPAWGNQLGDQLVFMLQGKLQTAEIKLNPAHLGPMEIRLSVHEDKASVTFISAHAPVREALDAALPRLRDMMEQQGLNLTHVDVSAHSGGQHEAFDRHGVPTGGAALANQLNETETPATVIRTQIESGLSVFV